MDYYNEFNPYPAAWIRNLQTAGHLPAGQVDERSIVDVQPKDLKGIRQAHFFAGIGGWPLALKLAGWPEDQEAWTGSCPCQPFSVAGGRKGTKDKRHLWPDFFRLIRECRPSVVFGEQVASKDGRNWLAGVRADLEGVGYEVGAADLCAASAGEEGEGWFLRGGSIHRERALIGAPHIRQRLFWVAHAKGLRHRPPSLETVSRRGERATRQDDIDVAQRVAHSEHTERRSEFQEDKNSHGRDGSRGGRDLGGMADASGGITSNGGVQRGREHGFRAEDGGSGERACRPIGGGEDEARGMADCQNESEHRGLRKCETSEGGGESRAERCGPASRVGNASDAGLQGNQHEVVCSARRGKEGGTTSKSGTSQGYWNTFDVLPCADGKARRVESGTFPLAHGVPGRVGKLRAYGNAIVSQVAVEFIQAYLEARLLYR